VVGDCDVLSGIVFGGVATNCTLDTEGRLLGVFDDEKIEGLYMILFYSVVSSSRPNCAVVMYRYGPSSREADT